MYLWDDLGSQWHGLAFVEGFSRGLVVALTLAFRWRSVIVAREIGGWRPMECR